MSGRVDKAEKSSGSKMLKKARSFRDDIKTRIKRRPSTGAQQMIPEGKQMKSKGKGSSGDIFVDVVDAKEDGDNESDRLHQDMEEIDRSMHFIRAVLNKGELLLIPQVASKLLEITFDIFTRLSSLLLSQDSTTLSSGHNKVCQSLARFIRWSDSFLLDNADGGGGGVDKENGDEIISTLAEGVRELTRLCLDKMAARRSAAASGDQQQQQPRSPSSQASLSPGGSGGVADSSARSSLPEIPLTPRERQILQQASDLGGIYDNAGGSPHGPLLSSSSHSPTVFTFDPASRDSPPPKPPLPHGAAQLLASSRQRNGGLEAAGLEAGEEPPPLPEKRRSAGTSMLDSLTSSTASSTTPTQSPYASMCLEGGGLSPAASPLSRSPASSVGSGLDRSTEDLLATGTATTVARTQSDSRIASLSVQSGRAQTTTCEEINQLTKKIKEMTTSIEDTPPPLPTKRGLMRLHSQYDNVPSDGLGPIPGVGVGGMGGNSLVSSTSLTSVSSRTVVTRTHESRISTASSSSSQSSHSFMSSQSVQSGKAWQNTTCLALGPGAGPGASSTTTERASSHETYSSSETFSSTASHSSTESLPRPPPLPPKKRHIQAYMQTFGALTQPISLDSISRHSINFYEAQWHQHQMELFQPLYPRSNTISVISDISSFSSDASFSSGSPERFSAESFSQGVPSLPVKTRRAINRQSHMSNESSQSDMSGGEPGLDKTQSLVEPLSLPLIIPEFSEMKRSSAPAQVVTTVSPPAPPPALPSPPTKAEIQRDADSDFAELNPLDDVDVSDQLIRKRPGEDGMEIRGGSVDALIVHATSAGNSEFIYQEAFLTTYRTFISPKALMEKLLYRFYKFQHAKDSKKRLAMNAFSLLIRVIDELGYTELDGDVQQRMMDLVYELLCQGELMLAKVLRKKLLDKRKQQLDAHDQSQSVQTVTLQQAHSPDLLHFKSHEIAENMTLMDAALFQKIEIPEVLLWAKEQSEELSPNLTHFTEHFNKMSYWCRTQILTQEDAKEREKFLMKFIKIMRHLRKLRNFNSYLAILSALDSAPVRRLEWQKQNLEALKEFCHLIDSSSSFRAYRKALAETEPPCIPYLGLILQDLTFINIGNQDSLPDGSVNFAKRWQQFNILDSMRRFKTCSYSSLKPNAKLVATLQNFDHYLSEEQLWQISETIKPRGGRKKAEAS